MVGDMDLIYRKIGSVETYVNSRKNITLRQLFAQHLANNVLS